VRKLLVHISINEVRLLGGASEFNAISRAIRKCQVGAVIRLPLEKQRCNYGAFEVRCTTGFAGVGAQGDTVFIAYPESLRRTLPPYFSMPLETQSGSQFFLSAWQMDDLRVLLGDSLTMVLDVGEQR